MKRFFSIVTVICVLIMSTGIPNVIAQKLVGTEIFFDDFSSSELKAGWTVTGTTEGDTAAIDATNQNYVLNKTNKSSTVVMQYKLDNAISSGRVDIEMTLKNIPDVSASNIQIRYSGTANAQYYNTMYRIDNNKIKQRPESDSGYYDAISNTGLSAETALTFKSSIDYDAAASDKVTSYINGAAASSKHGFITGSETSLQYIRIYVPGSSAAGLIIDDFKIIWYPAGSVGNFEDFSGGALDSTVWTVTGNGGGVNCTNVAALDSNNQSFRLYNPEAAEIGLQYNFDSDVGEGTVAAEFTVRMNATTGNQLQVKFRNRQNNDIAAMRLRPNQIPELQSLDQAGNVTNNNVGSDKLELNNDIRIKVVFDYTAKTATAFVNGTDIGTAVALRDISNIALNNIYTRVHQSHGPLDASIDNFNVYQVGGVAENIANTYNNIDLGNTSAVSEDLTLVTEDTDNGTTISWASDNESVITSEGVLGAKKGTANLTATISTSGMSVIRNFVIVTPDSYYFENFDNDTKPSGWAGGSLDTGNKLLSIPTVTVNVAHYTLSSPITKGGVAIEFDINKQNSDDKYMQLHLQNSSKNSYKDIARISMSGDRVRMVDFDNGVSLYRVSDSTKIETGRWINVKLELDFNSKQTSLYVDGRKANFDVPFYDSASAELGRIYFNIPSAQKGAEYLLDNFKIYALGGTADETCLGTELGFDKTNVTSNISLPGTINGGTVTWASSNTAVVTDNGIVTRPSDSDAEVVLTRTVEKGDVTNKTDFRITVPANKGSVKYMGGDFKDAAGNPVLLTANAAVKGTAKINNDTEEAVTVTIVTALYKDGLLNSFAVDTVAVPAGATDVTIAGDTITLPADLTNYDVYGAEGEQNYVVKRFLITSLDELRPLLDAEVLQ